MVRLLLEQAFPTTAEADLVEALRADGDAAVSVIAADDGGIVGYATLSRMSAPFLALALGPVAVLPALQRRGIGTRVVRYALRLAGSGCAAVFVLGEPSYYSRFGFRVEAARGFQSPYAGPHFMALPLVDPLPHPTGRVDYAPAFAVLG